MSEPSFEIPARRPRRAGRQLLVVLVASIIATLVFTAIHGNGKPGTSIQRPLHVHLLAEQRLNTSAWIVSWPLATRSTSGLIITSANVVTHSESVSANSLGQSVGKGSYPPGVGSQQQLVAAGFTGFTQIACYRASASRPSQPCRSAQLAARVVFDRVGLLCVDGFIVDYTERGVRYVETLPMTLAIQVHAGVWHGPNITPKYINQVAAKCAKSARTPDVKKRWLQPRS